MWWMRLWTCQDELNYFLKMLLRFLKMLAGWDPQDGESGWLLRCRRMGQVWRRSWWTWPAGVEVLRTLSAAHCQLLGGQCSWALLQVVEGSGSAGCQCSR